LAVLWFKLLSRAVVAIDGEELGLKAMTEDAGARVLIETRDGASAECSVDVN
jgi:hypothetical protein